MSDGASNHQPHVCLHNRLFRWRSKKTSKLRVTGLCVGNSPVTDEFPAQKASNAENVSIWWRHHDIFAYDRAIVMINTLYDHHFFIIPITTLLSNSNYEQVLELMQMHPKEILRRVILTAS